MKNEYYVQRNSNLGRVTFTTLKFENASYKYKRTFFGLVNFVKKNTFSNVSVVNVIHL